MTRSPVGWSKTSIFCLGVSEDFGIGFFARDGQKRSWNCESTLERITSSGVKIVPVLPY